VIDPLSRVSVRTKLALLFVSLCLLAYGLGGSLVSRWTETALSDEILARLDYQCRVYATTLDASLQLLERRLEDFASDGYIRDHAVRLQTALHEGDTAETGRLREELQRHLAQNNLPLFATYLNLEVTDRMGELLATVHEDAERLIDLPTRESLADVTRAGGLLDPPGLLVSTPLRDLSGPQIVGHLHVLVDARAWVREAIASHTGDRTSHGLDVNLLLHDGRGRRLVATPGAGRLLRVMDDDVNGPVPSLRPNDAPTIAPVRGIYARSFPVSTSGWWVEVTLGVERALLPVSGLKSRLLGIGIVLALLSTLLLYFPMRFLVRPLVRLTRAAERLREGQLDTRVLVESEDEIGELGHTFNNMAGAIQERTGRLEHTASDLRERQSELRAERDRVEAVIASMHDGLVVLDGRGKVVLSNTAAQPLLSLIEHGGSASGHHVCLEERLGATTGHECFACLMDTGGPPRSCSVDVGSRTFEIHTTPLPPDEAGGRGRVLVAREVTDRVKQDEREIHNERLAVLGEVAAVVAHEINNPLASISMFNQMLAAELPEESPLRENTDVISRNIDSAKHAIRELLDYATGSTPEVGRLDVHDVLEDVQRFLRPLSDRAGVTVQLLPEAEHAEVTGDEIQLRQVFVNLTMNAIQAVADQPVREVSIATHNDGDRLVVDVSDTGPGIDGDQRSRIFRPFFTTKPRGEGTGLGLPTARRIAEMHGGSVEVVDSRIGDGTRGTTLRVRLRSRVEVGMAGWTGSDS
jgi:signal transduction histidine kinase